MHPDALSEILDGISHSKRLQFGHELLSDALRQYGLQHVAYLGLNIPSKRRPQALVAATYSPEWQRHYEQVGYVNIDPVVRSSLRGVMPVDWAKLDRSDAAVKKLFGQAQDFRIAGQGLSIPIHGRGGEFGLFSITADLTDCDWTELKRRDIGSFMLIGHHFHEWALHAEGLDHSDYSNALTSHQIEMLRWAAAGKTADDTAVITGLSRSTVQFHLANARGLLHASTTTQAVAKAIAHGILSLA